MGVDQARIPPLREPLFGEVHQAEVGALLEAFEDDLIAVGGDVEVADVEIVG